jgi:hypothetical protein
MPLQKSLIVTNVTKVKNGGSGKYVTINCYETEEPKKDDVLYQISVNVDELAIRELMEELKIDQPPVEVNDRINLPTGIRVSVEFTEARTGDYGDNRRFLNRVTKMKFEGYARKDVDFTFPAKAVMFKDWGIVIETREKEFLEDKFVIFFSELPFKVSSAMNKFKMVANNDVVRVKGRARVMYSTFMSDDKSWNVKPKYRFDSRFDEIVDFSVVPEIPSIKAMYFNNLKLLQSNDEYTKLIEWMMDSWKDGFVGDQKIVQKALSNKIILDPVLVPSIFFDVSQLKCFFYTRSMLDDKTIVYYYMRDSKFKYVVMHDPGGTVLWNGKVTVPRLLVYDTYLSMIYCFAIDPTARVPEMLDRVKNKVDGLFLDRVVPGEGIEFKFKVKADERTSREWLPKLVE